VEAVKHGDAVEPLVAALKVEGERKKALTRELENLAAVAQVASFDADRIKADLRARVADVKGLLARRKPQARQMLRKVLPGKIELTPVEENGRRGYRFTAQGTFENCCQEPSSKPYHGRWWPQRDSNPCFSLERAVSLPVLTRV
jgi:hypothetical protein